MKTFNSFLLIFLLLFFSCQEQQPVVLTYAGQTMGTSYHIKIVTNTDNADAENSLQTGIDSVLRDVNMQMSTYIPESEISRFNSYQDVEPFEVSSEFIKVLVEALQMNKDSQGAFDVTVAPLVNLWGFGKDGERNEPPKEKEIEEVRSYVGSSLIHIIDKNHISKDNPHTELDFSAIAKGYGVDVVAGFLNDRGFNNYLVEIGGEIVVKGSNNHNKWKVGIDRPEFDKDPGADLEEIIELSNVGIATSGDYRNYFVVENRVYSHAIDPVSGRPIVTGVASATVIAADCMSADALATALMVMGVEEGIKLVENRENVEVFIVLRDGDGFKEVMSSGFAKYLQE